MTAKDIIDRLGGTSKLAALIGAPVTTVDSWKSANSIPPWRQPKLLELAAQHGLALSTADFPTPEQRRSRAAA